ncbi:hypothetical protein G9A89_009718 [Geosiphon pyriformis]|nr:hypothetical protein G9A89_009718 [Geosiphon pyriformis]
MSNTGCAGYQTAVYSTSCGHDIKGKYVKAVATVASMLNRDVKFLTKKCDRISLEDVSDDNDMDDNNNKVKNFSTAKWMSGMVKNSHELVNIMGKMYEFDMFNTLGSKDSTSM